jgi:hypothetical protein
MQQLQYKTTATLIPTQWTYLKYYGQKGNQGTYPPILAAAVSLCITCGRGHSTIIVYHVNSEKVMESSDHRVSLAKLSLPVRY